MKEKINLLEKEINIKTLELKKKREEINFLYLISENEKLNIKIRELYSKLNENNDLSSSDSEKINNQIKDYKTQKEKNNSIISQSKKEELEVFNLYKKIESIIYSKDKPINKLKIKILNNNKKIDKLDQKINYINNPDSIKNEIASLEEEIEKNKKIIKLKKEKNEQYVYFIYNFNSLKTQKNELLKKLKNAEKDDLEKISIQKENYLKENEELSKKLDIKTKDLNHLLDLFNKTKNSLEIDVEESNKYSFIIEDLNIFYGSKKAIHDVNIKIPKNKVISIIGPSGCGKSTFLRTLNRINDTIPNFKYYGKIILDGKYDIRKLKSVTNKYDKIDLTTLRTKVGMIFQQPNPFNMSIFKNVAYGPKVNGINQKIILNDIVKDSLEKAALWNEVKNNLNVQATSLSGGQQQRLCIARAIANKPEILLMDEPTSALDPIASKKIEELILKLKENYTIILVTHSMQQAQRISDYTIFFYEGKMIEMGKTKEIFENPKHIKTKEYISGKFG